MAIRDHREPLAARRAGERRAAPARRGPIVPVNGDSRDGWSITVDTGSTRSTPCDTDPCGRQHEDRSPWSLRVVTIAAQEAVGERRRPRADDDRRAKRAQSGGLVALQPLGDGFAYKIGHELPLPTARPAPPAM